MRIRRRWVRGARRSRGIAAGLVLLAVAVAAHHGLPAGSSFHGDHADHGMVAAATCVGLAVAGGLVLAVPPLLRRLRRRRRRAPFARAPRSARSTAPLDRARAGPIHLRNAVLVR